MSALRTDTTDHVRTLTLDRPEARNALDASLLAAIVAALEDADRDEDVAVVILTGSDPAFCAGLDLKAIEAGELDMARTADDDLDPWIALARMTTPVIGAVNGPAVTGGLELALNCHLLVGSERASFADTHARVGIHPGGGLTVLLPQAIGLRRAREMSLTGNYIDAAEAHRLGLLNHVVPHAELLPTARALAADIVGNDQAAVQALNDTYTRTSATTLAEGRAFERERYRAWRVDAAAVGQRRAAVTERGRTQARTR